MKILLTLFPEWIKKQFILNTHARDGFVFLEMRRVVWGLPQAGILSNKWLRKRLKQETLDQIVSLAFLSKSIFKK